MTHCLDKKPTVLLPPDYNLNADKNRKMEPDTPSSLAAVLNLTLVSNVGLSSPSVGSTSTICVLVFSLLLPVALLPVALLPVALLPVAPLPVAPPVLLPVAPPVPLPVAPPVDAGAFKISQPLPFHPISHTHFLGSSWPQCWAAPLHRTLPCSQEIMGLSQ